MNKQTQHILIIEKMHPDGLALLNQEKNLNINHLIQPIASVKLQQMIHQYQAIIIRSKTKLNHILLESAKQLQLIVRLGSGLDNIDIKIANQQQIEVFRPQIGNTISAAEHTFGLIICLTRHIHQANTSIKQGMWIPKSFFSQELYQKQLGIIGLGRIGTRVAIMAQAFGMTVIACDPYIDKSKIHPQLQNSVALTDLNSLCAKCSWISLHVPLKEDTYHMISHKQIQQMWPSTRLINTSRGLVIDENALIQALKNKKIHSVAIDTLTTEPLPPEHPFIHMDNVLLTPHMGGMTEEAEQRMSIESAVKILQFFECPKNNSKLSSTSIPKTRNDS